MTATKFILDSRSRQEDGRSVLKISVSKSGTTSYINTGISLFPEEWDVKKNKVVKHPQRKIMNLVIQQRKLQFDKVLYRLTLEGRLALMTAAQVRDAVQTEIDPYLRFAAGTENLFANFYTRCAERKRDRTKEVYLYTLRRVEEYVGEKTLKKLKFEDLTKSWLEGFDRWLESQGSRCNTRGIHFRNIRSVFNDAIDEQVTETYPFRRFKIRKEQTEKRALKVDELRRLFDFPIDPLMRRWLDFFKLDFFLIGINVVDLVNLETVKNGRVEFYRSKTGRLYSIKVEPEAAEIINRYRGRRFLLDIRDHYCNHRDFLHRMNENLQKIGPIDYGKQGRRTYHPLFPQLTTYWARHTWATIAASLDIPKETIAAALGHGGNTVTDIYIDFDRNKIDEANRQVMDFVLYRKHPDKK